MKTGEVRRPESLSPIYDREGTEHKLVTLKRVGKDDSQERKRERDR